MRGKYDINGHTSLWHWMKIILYSPIYTAAEIHNKMNSISVTRYYIFGREVLLRMMKSTIDALKSRASITVAAGCSWCVFLLLSLVM